MLGSLCALRVKLLVHGILYWTDILVVFYAPATARQENRVFRSSLMATTLLRCARQQDKEQVIDSVEFLTSGSEASRSRAAVAERAVAGPWEGVALEPVSVGGSHRRRDDPTTQP